MKVTTTNIFECENEKEYEAVMNSIEDEQADIEDMNNITEDNMTLEVFEDRDNLKIKTIGVYTN